jgi:peptidoglycan/xylan/chitin deacetylase (PgdA/CDA1 family)
MWRAVFTLISPAGPRARLSVLIFHRVHAAPDPLFPQEPDARSFAAQLRWLKRSLHLLPLREGVERLLASALPARALCITFDDGYADNLTVAAPILGLHAAPATVFVASGFLDGGAMWNDVVIEALRRCARPALSLPWLQLGTLPLRSVLDRRTAIDAVIGKLKYLPAAARAAHAARLAEEAGVDPPRDLMLTSAQVKALSALGIGIGAHTVTHPILTALEPAAARREMLQSKADLESIVGEPVDLFAYPNGKPGRDYDASHVRMARESGFKAAFTTSWGTGRAGSDPYQLPRFTPWASSRGRRGLQLARNIARVRAAQA